MSLTIAGGGAPTQDRVPAVLPSDPRHATRRWPKAADCHGHAPASGMMLVTRNSWLDAVPD
jgi:hypothetical protein